LQQILSRQFLAAPDNIGDAAVPQRQRPFLAALAAKLETDVRPLHPGVAVAQGGQAKASVLGDVIIVADADERRFEQAHDGRENLFTRHAATPQMRLDRAADGRENLRKKHHVFELGDVAHRAKIRVIAILLPPLRVAPGRLEMAVRLRADPDVRPGGRNRQRLDPRQMPRICQRRAVGTAVDECVALFYAGKSGATVGDVAKARGFGVVPSFSVRRGNFDRHGSALCARAPSSVANV